VEDEAKPDEIAELLVEVRIARQLEGPDAMRARLKARAAESHPGFLLA
jgi:hypothetical protein